MVLLVTNKGKEQHYARVIERIPTARPSVQVTMKAASQTLLNQSQLQAYSTNFIKMGLTRVESHAQIPTEATF